MDNVVKDVDMLRQEAELFNDVLHLPWQVLRAGTGGTIADTSFTSLGAGFTAAGVQAGHVIHLKSVTAGLDGAYEIVSVNSPSSLVISVVRAGDDEIAVGPGDATDVEYRICTYAPQARQVLLKVTEHFGLRPGAPDGQFSIDDVADPTVFRRALLLAVLGCAYVIQAGRVEDRETVWRKSEHYGTLFKQALKQCRIAIDTAHDGTIDTILPGADVRLMRE